MDKLIKDIDKSIEIEEEIKELLKLQQEMNKKSLSIMEKISDEIEKLNL